MRTALVATFVCGLAACRSDGPRATGAPGDARMLDVAAAADVVASADAVVSADMAADVPGLPPGPRPVKASAGCGKGTRAEGIQYIQSGGRRLNFTLRLPAGYDPGRPSPMGLAFADYAYPQCTVNCRGFSALDAITLFPMTWTLSWDEPAEALQANTLFFEDMVAFVKNEYCVDENRIFLAGAGMGARFAQALACKHGDWLWQVAPISAPAHRDPDCRGKPAALVIHGVEDNGAEAGQAVVENLAARNGCAATPPPGLAAARDELLAAYRANRPESRCLDWPGCSSPVRLCLVSNRLNGPTDFTQGHRGWPSSGGTLIGEFLDRLDP